MKMNTVYVKNVNKERAMIEETKKMMIEAIVAMKMAAYRIQNTIDNIDKSVNEYEKVYEKVYEKKE